MSTEVTSWWNRAALILGLLSGGGALTGMSFLVTLPARVTAQDQRLDRLAEERKTDRELLVRIEERLKSVQAALSNPNPKNP